MSPAVPATPASQAPLQIAPAPAPVPVGKPGRVIAFLSIVAIAALWLQHHLGFEFAKLGVVATALTIWGLVGKLAGWIDEQQSQKGILELIAKRPLRAVVRFMTRSTPLYATGIIVGVVMMTVSSVTVRSDTPGERAAITLGALEAGATPNVDTLTRDQSIVRFFPVLTSPFGRLYHVDADGYIATSVNVYPPIARQLVLGRDLSATPSVLFRPFDEGVVALADSAEFQVKRLTSSGQWEPLGQSAPTGVPSSFIIGRRKPISDAAMVVWALEATANGAPEAARAQLLVTWRSPKSVSIQGQLRPRDCLLAEIRLHGALKERALVQLSNDPLIDVLMHAAGADTTKVPSC